MLSQGCTAKGASSREKNRGERENKVAFQGEGKRVYRGDSQDCPGKEEATAAPSQYPQSACVKGVLPRRTTQEVVKHADNRKGRAVNVERAFVRRNFTERKNWERGRVTGGAAAQGKTLPVLRGAR